MKKLYKLIFLVIGMIVILPGVILAQLTVSIQPQEITVNLSEPCSIDVIVENVTNLGAFQFDVQFDVNVVHAQTAIMGSFLGSTGRTVLPVGPTIDNGSVPGNLTFGGASFGTNAGPNGTGVLATVVFIPQAEGITPIELNNVQIADINGAAQTLEKIVHGQIQVGITTSAKVTFLADMSDLIAKAWFNPSTDSIRVVGSFNDWTNTELMTSNPFDPLVYSYDLNITATPGTELEWKFRAFPSSHFLNDGWEVGFNQIFIFTGQDLVLDLRKPAIYPSGPPLSQDVTARFSVNMANAVDWYNQSPFTNIKAVFINGDFVLFGGGWSNWAVTDTASMIRMWDDGKNGGDATAGDQIWTAEHKFFAGTMSNHMYKYGCYADGVDTLNNGINPIDNEAGFCMDHFLSIDDSSPLMILPTDRFGSQWISVEIVTPQKIPSTFELNQNYPNPFNPTTTIPFEIKSSGHLTLKVCNLMGQEIATLVDDYMEPGFYHINFDASTLTAGIYLYRLNTGSYIETKKMIVLK